MKSSRMFEAINYATVAHKGQIRKSTGIPQIVHPFGVAMILQREGYEEDLIIAGLFHDVVEDCEGYTLEDIESKFGGKVAKYVSDVSEPDKSLPWKERKLRHIEYIKNTTFESKVLCAADKLHNLTALYEDLKIYGDELWNKFNAPKEETRWYYRSMYQSIVSGFENDNVKIFSELKKILDLTVGGE